jgi:hypothetical protein
MRARQALLPWPVPGTQGTAVRGHSRLPPALDNNRAQRHLDPVIDGLRNVRGLQSAPAGALCLHTASANSATRSGT